MRLAAAFLTLAFLASAGCITHTEFEPLSAVPEAKITDRAVRFYPNDAALLKEAGGELIGSVASSGNKYATQGTLSDRALSEAADHGGTHVLLESSGFDESFFATPGHAQTNCQAAGNNVNCSSTYTPGGVHSVYRPHARFLVVRVPQARWSDLPPALQPQPVGR